MDPRALAVVLGIFLFFYIPTPTVTSVFPNSGTSNGPVHVVVNGDKFDKKATVELAMQGQENIDASDVQVISPNKIECSFDLKDRQVGKWDLIIHNKLIKSATLKEGFMITAPAPRVKMIAPERAYNSTTVKVEINGSSFKPGAEVMLINKQMNIGAANVTVVSDSLITCELNLNGAALGVYDVKVFNGDGAFGTLANGFIVEDLPKPVIKVVKPVIEGIDPNKGFNNGMILTRISGSNFEPGSTVKLSRNGQSEIPGLNIKVSDSTQISCFFDIDGKPEGQYNLEVISPSGQQAVLANGFTVEHFTPNSLELNKSLKAVYFDLNKTMVRRDQFSSLETDLAVLKKYLKLYILLGGHADERGTIEYNLDLSERRTIAIKKYLLEKGMDPNRITIYAYGKEFPLEKGHNESSWWHNRRVDIMVWEAPPTKVQGLEEIEEPGGKNRK
jgi:outer membrane protein OmpA-like peptidoglycan-associated protein